MRNVFWLAAIAPLLGACEIRPKCTEDEAAQPEATCTAAQEAAAFAGAVGFSDPWAAGEGEVVRVEARMLAVALDRGGEVRLDWPAALPFEVRVGERARIERGRLDGVVLATGELWTMKEHRHGVRLGETVLSLTHLCTTSGGGELVELVADGPEGTRSVAPGGSVALGGWTFENHGAVAAYRPPEACAPEPDAYVPVVAWRAAECPPGEAPPVDCEAAVAETNAAFDFPAGPLGLAAAGALELPAELELDAVGDGELRFVGVEAVFRHPDAAAWGLAAGDRVRVDAGGRWSLLAHGGIERAIFFDFGFTVPDAAPGLPEAPALRFEGGCHDAPWRTAAALVVGEGEARLLPGDEAALGPWTLRHRGGYELPPSGCGGGIVEGYGFALLTAERAIE